MCIIKKLKFNRFSITVLSLLSVLGLCLYPPYSSAEISVDSYTQLTIAEMQQQISNYQELITLANQYKDDPATLSQQEAIKRALFDQEKETRYSSFGTTAQEYVLYMGKNGNAVKTYLDANPSIKQQIDDLSAQIRALMEEHHVVKESINQLEGQPLP